MAEFLFVFGYESPARRLASQPELSAQNQESCSAVWVSAVNEEAGLRAGRSYAERWVHDLFREKGVERATPVGSSPIMHTGSSMTPSSGSQVWAWTFSTALRADNSGGQTLLTLQSRSPRVTVEVVKMQDGGSSLEDPELDAVRGLISQGQKIAGIKTLREATGWGLLEVMTWIDRALASWRLEGGADRSRLPSLRAATQDREGETVFQLRFRLALGKQSRLMSSTSQ